MSPFGLGNDIGGSLRNPAYCCGIASLKPSIGRLPFVNSIEPVDMGISGAFLTDGPMARSVDDLRNGLKVMAGRHIDDPQSVDAPLTGVIPDKPKAALIREIPGFKLTDATLREIDRAGSILADRGWIVEEKQAPEVPRVYEIWGTVLNNGMMGAIPPEVFKKETADYLERESRQFLENGISLDEALIERRRLRRLWSAFLTEYAVCIGPTWTNPPWPIDTDLDPDKGPDELSKSFIFIAPGNCLGIPSVALPMGVSENLPTGIQIYSEVYREDLCLGAAEIIQSEATCPTPIDPVL